MKQVNNLIYADSGKILKTPNGYTSIVNLGTNTIIKDGEIFTYTINLEDVEEYNIIQIENEPYYFKSNTYGEVVSELIRAKYSLDEELALYANSRINSNSSKEIEFQNWRQLCKQAAKKIFK